MNYHRDKDYLKNESTFRNIFRKRFNIIQKYTSGPGKVLEIGCSNGVFLDIFKEKGFETWGVEPSGSAKTAKEKGHRVIQSIFEQAELPAGYFDLVIVNHTLEHMDDPLSVLKKINTLLKEDGTIFIDVPNAGGLGAKLLGKYWPYRLLGEHKWQFTRQSLEKFVKEAGFKVVHFESRSGVFEYANPLLELHRKRFLLDLITIPYSIYAAFLNMGDSMSLICKKVG